jgi:hypothetical protein
VDSAKPIEPRSDYVGFVVDKAAMGQVFSEHFGFACHSFHRLLRTHHQPSSGANTIGQMVSDVPNALSDPIPRNYVSLQRNQIFKNTSNTRDIPPTMQTFNLITFI